MIPITKEVKIAGAVSVLFLILTIAVSLLYIIPLPTAGAMSDIAPFADTEALDTVAETGEAQSGQEQESSYLLKDCGGYVGIFTAGGSDEPDIVTEIIISKLRAADAETLKEGIPANSPEELAKIIEDLNS